MSDTYSAMICSSLVLCLKTLPCDLNFAIEVNFFFDHIFINEHNTYCNVHDMERVITYIIGHYNSSVRIIDLVSHTTYDLGVNFIHKWRDLHFKVDLER